MARSSSRQPFLAHVDELRQRLFVSVVVLFAGTALGYLLRDSLLHLLVSPLNQPLYYTAPGGGFTFVLQLCLGFGLVVAIPVLIFHTLRFLSPVLPPHSGWWLVGALISSCGLVAAGMAFAYLVSLPAALHFLNAFSTDQVHALISTDTYLTFVLTYLAAFAVLFQLPLVLVIANRLVPLSPRMLLKETRWVIVGCFILAAIITPTQDPMNQTLMAGPVIALYLVSIGLIWFLNRRPTTDTAVSLRSVDELMLELTLARATLTARQPTVARDGRSGALCQWEERRRGHVRRRLVTFEHDGQHELVRVDQE